LPLILWAQPTYMNVQYDFSNQWQTTGCSTVESDSFYIVNAPSGTPFINILDTSLVLMINKYDGQLSVDTMGYFLGQTGVNILPYKNNYLLHGQHYNGHDYVEHTDAFFCIFKVKSGIDTSTIRTYGLPGRGDYFYRPIPTSDGGFFSTGWSFEPTGRSSLIFFKCDSNLNQQYFKLYPPNPTQNHFAAGVVETPDKHILLVGSRRDMIYYDNAVICKLDTAGNVVLWKEIPHQGDTTNLFIYDITPKNDGTYLLIGSWVFNPQIGPGYEQYWVLNMDENGNILWKKRHHFEFFAGWQTITPSLDGNFYACGWATTYNDTFPTGFRQYAVISKLTPNGDLLWHRKYLSSPDGKSYDQFFNVLATSDGGILCNGTTYENDTTRQNAWIVKLDGNGCLNPSQPGCVSDTDEPILLPVGQNSWITLSPNPTTGLVRINAKEEHRIEYLRVYDTAGRLVEERKVPKEFETTCDLSSQRAGTYIFSVLVDGVWTVRQVVKL
jgi:Secretion system C-terminal sorting domain